MTGVKDMSNSQLSTYHVSGIRESARRFLTAKNVEFILAASKSCEINYCDDFEKLVLKLMDSNPALIIDAEISDVLSEQTYVQLFIDGDLLVQLGGEIPKKEEICWVMGELEMIWPYFKTNCIDLVLAGYPGCENCIGDGLGVDWSELSNRERMFATTYDEKQDSAIFP